MRTTLKRSAAVAGSAVLLFGVSGIAYAFWTEAGTGTGTAETGTTTPITIVQTSSPSALYPGGPTGLLAGTFTNPNAGPIFVGQISVVIPGTFSARLDTSKPACTAADFTLVNPSATNKEVSADDTTTWTGGSIALRNTAANQDNCKNVIPPLAYTSN